MLGLRKEEVYSGRRERSERGMGRQEGEVKGGWATGGIGSGQDRLWEQRLREGKVPGSTLPLTLVNLVNFAWSAPGCLFRQFFLRCPLTPESADQLTISWSSKRIPDQLTAYQLANSSGPHYFIAQISTSTSSQLSK